jgi:exonuclease SbcC
MSLSKNFSLSSIFEHAIGVNQGTFTAPFLMNPSDRSKIFAPLLNVHIYKNIFTKYIDINHSFKDEIQNLEKEISYIEGELKDKDLYTEQQTNIEEKLRELRVSSIIKITNFNRIEKKYKEWKQLKKNLEQITKEFVKLEFSNKNLDEKLEIINEEIEEATSAKKICSESEDDFLKYKEFSKHERELQEKYDKLQKNLNKINQLKQSLIKLDAELHQISIQIEKINKKSGLLPNLKKKFIKNKSIQDEIHNLAIQIESKTVMQENLDILIRDNEILQKKIRKLQKSLKSLPEIEKKCALIEPLNHKINNLNQKIAVKEEEIKTLKQNKQDSKGGKCPFLHEKCKNIEGDSLEDFFQKRIDEEQLTKKVSKTKLIEFKKELENLRKEEGKFKSLERAQIELEQFEEQSKENSVKIKGLKEKTINKEKLENDKKNLQEEQKHLEKDVKQYNIINENIIIDLPELNQEKIDIEKKILNQKDNLEPFEKIIKDLEDVPNLLKDIRNKMNLTHDKYNAYQENVKSMKKLPKYKNERIEIESDLQKIMNKLKKREKEKLNLEEQYDAEQFLKLEQDKEQAKIESIKMQADIENQENNLANIIKKFEVLSKIEKNLIQKNLNWDELKKISDFSEKIRIWFKEAQPKITEALMARINNTASELYRKITDDEAIQLKWQKDYDIHVITTQNPLRIFSQLSGGEQMSAALAVRLAVLKVLTKIDFAFFDEPTTNLDSERRKNLSKCIQNIRGFKQLFVISHDDTFEENADYSIHFSKNSYDETVITS